LLTQPAPPELATFDRAKIVSNYLVQDWTTACGTIGWAHPLKSASPSVLSLSEAVCSQSWEHMHEWYAAFVLVTGGLNLDLAPQLQAVDIHSGNRRSNVYQVDWRQAASILGTSPPWFHHSLRDPQAMLAWKPGDPPAIIAADDIETPAQALLEFATDEPDGSPAAAVCLWRAGLLSRRSRPKRPSRAATAPMFTSRRYPFPCCARKTIRRGKQSSGLAGRRSSSGAMFSRPPPPTSS
jgi:hypothetical protein